MVMGLGNNLHQNYNNTDRSFKHFLVTENYSILEKNLLFKAIASGFLNLEC